MRTRSSPWFILLTLVASFGAGVRAAPEPLNLAESEYADEHPIPQDPQRLYREFQYVTSHVTNVGGTHSCRLGSVTLSCRYVIRPHDDRYMAAENDIRLSHVDQKMELYLPPYQPFDVRFVMKHEGAWVPSTLVSHGAERTAQLEKLADAGSTFDCVDSQSPHAQNLANNYLQPPDPAIAPAPKSHKVCQQIFPVAAEHGDRGYAQCSVHVYSTWHGPPVACVGLALVQSKQTWLLAEVLADPQYAAGGSTEQSYAIRFQRPIDVRAVQNEVMAAMAKPPFDLAKFKVHEAGFEGENTAHVSHIVAPPWRFERVYFRFDFDQMGPVWTVQTDESLLVSAQNIASPDEWSEANEQQYDEYNIAVRKVVTTALIHGCRGHGHWTDSYNFVCGP